LAGQDQLTHLGLEVLVGRRAPSPVGDWAGDEKYARFSEQSGRCDGHGHGTNAVSFEAPADAEIFGQQPDPAN
jgi:hypothetical protein